MLLLIRLSDLGRELSHPSGRRQVRASLSNAGSRQRMDGLTVWDLAIDPVRTATGANMIPNPGIENPMSTHNTPLAD